MSGDLPFPVYFVFKPFPRALGELLESCGERPADEQVDEVYKFFASQLDDTVMTAPINWALQSFVQLKSLGLDVHLVPDFQPEQICVAAYVQLPTRAMLSSYVVACQYDVPRPGLCHQRIVQNQLQVAGPEDHWVCHWPQPGIKPRRNDRGDRLERLVFKGRRKYLADEFQQPEFTSGLGRLGIELVTAPSTGDFMSQWESWKDYREADLVLAVRDVVPEKVNSKPPSKLINAWLADCPALLGPEPAFDQLRESPLDYLEVSTASDVLDAIVDLKRQPGKYRAMIEQGRKRASEVTAEALAGQWQRILSGPVSQGYLRWRNASVFRRKVGRAFDAAIGRWRHRRSRRAWPD